ncbi:MAG: hypothetical protein RR473_13695 [Comamonas sp.]|nr:hypothetical protein [Comamonas sp. lk]
MQASAGADLQGQTRGLMATVGFKNNSFQRLLGKGWKLEKLKINA